LCFCSELEAVEIGTGVLDIMPDNLLAKALFAELLQELTFNSKDVINKLTVFAGSNKSAANDIHSLLTERLREVCTNQAKIKNQDSIVFAHYNKCDFLVVVIF